MDQNENIYDSVCVNVDLKKFKTVTNNVINFFFIDKNEEQFLKFLKINYVNFARIFEIYEKIYYTKKQNDVISPLKLFICLYDYMKNKLVYMNYIETNISAIYEYMIIVNNNIEYMPSINQIKNHCHNISEKLLLKFYNIAGNNELNKFRDRHRGKYSYNYLIRLAKKRNSKYLNLKLKTTKKTDNLIFEKINFKTDEFKNLSTMTKKRLIKKIITQKKINLLNKILEMNELKNSIIKLNNFLKNNQRYQISSYRVRYRYKIKKNSLLATDSFSILIRNMYNNNVKLIINTKIIKELINSIKSEDLLFLIKNDDKIKNAIKKYFENINETSHKILFLLKIIKNSECDDIIYFVDNILSYNKIHELTDAFFTFCLINEKDKIIEYLFETVLIKPTEDVLKRIFGCIEYNINRKNSHLIEKLYDLYIKYNIEIPIKIYTYAIRLNNKYIIDKIKENNISLKKIRLKNYEIIKLLRFKPNEYIKYCIDTKISFINTFIEFAKKTKITNKYSIKIFNKFNHSVSKKNIYQYLLILVCSFDLKTLKLFCAKYDKLIRLIDLDKIKNQIHEYEFISYYVMIRDKSENLKICIYLMNTYGKDLTNKIISPSIQTTVLGTCLLYGLNNNLEDNEYMDIIKESIKYIDINRDILYNTIADRSENVKINNKYIDLINEVTIKNGFVRAELFKFFIMKKSKNELKKIFDEYKLKLDPSIIIDTIFIFFYSDEYQYFKNIRDLVKDNDFENKKCILYIIDFMDLCHNLLKINKNISNEYELTNVLNNCYLYLMKNKKNKNKITVINDHDNESDIIIEKNFIQKYLQYQNWFYDINYDLVYENFKNTHNINMNDYFHNHLKINNKKIDTDVEDLDDIINNIIDPNYKKPLNIDDIEADMINMLQEFNV